MKRVNEGVEGGNGDLGAKKVRNFNEIDENYGAAEKNRGEQAGGLVGNGVLDGSHQVDRNCDFFRNTVVPDNPFGPNLDVPKESNPWDDIDFVAMFAPDLNGLGFDINVPVYGMENDGLKNGYQEYNQGPGINEKEVEVIDIASDDSEDEVEIIGFTNTSGYNDKGKQIASEVPYDRMETNLSLGLGLSRMNNFLGESSSAAGGGMRYIGEEVENSIRDSSFSFDASFHNFLDQLPVDASIRSVEPIEEIEAGTWQPAAMSDPVRSASAERVLMQDEQTLRRSIASYRDAWKETAKRYARTVVNESSSQVQIPYVALAPQLGTSPGPFSEALKMVRARTCKRSAEELIEWKRSEEYRGKATHVPSLLNLSLKALAENADGLVSLELVPDFLRKKLIDLLGSANKMNVHILNLLLEGCPTEIRIKNCSWLTEIQFQQVFGNCQTNCLRVLQLDLCGQCMLDFAFKNTFSRSSQSLSSLAIVSLRGACRLSDDGLKELVMSAPALMSINLGQCALLTCNAINFISEYLGSSLRELYIDGCPKIKAMKIVPAFKHFKCLEVLSVASLRGVTDLFITEMVDVCGPSIKELDLADCLKLTDRSIKIIGSSCADLRSLNISYLHNLTDLTLEYLANGCKSIERLLLHRNGFSDEAMAAFLESSGESLVELSLNNLRAVGANTALSLAKCSRKLLSLDISWCRKISNEALGLIVDGCSSLKLLKVFGCRQITKVFLEGHSNRQVKIIGQNLTPVLDHLNLLEPDEVFLRYSPLPIWTEAQNRKVRC